MRSIHTSGWRGTRKALYIDIAIFLVTLFFLLVLTIEAAAQDRRSNPIPVKVGQTSDGLDRYMTFRDLEQLKDVANGWIYALVGIGLKVAFDLFMKWRDKTGDNIEEMNKKMDQISNLIAKIDIRISHIENTSISRHEVQNVVENEIDKFRRWTDKPSG